MSAFFSEHFSHEQAAFMKDAFTARNDAQYYVDHIVAEETQKKMEKEAPRLLVHCKDLVISLDEKTVERIRAMVKLGF